MRALLLALLLAVAPAAYAAPGYANWAVVVVSGDDEAAHVEEHTEAFDNARRDVVLALEGRGFSPGDIAQFTVEPERHPTAESASLPAIAKRLHALGASGAEGCLFYLTSHGSPDGALIGERIVPAARLARLIGGACGSRPTVVVISACYSGVFVKPLSGPRRMVLTAARADRSSFGCGESDRYPYFDGCILASLPHTADFVTLAAEARACVARRERETGMTPPSEPQIFIGPGFHADPFPPWRAPGPAG